MTGSFLTTTRVPAEYPSARPSVQHIFSGRKVVKQLSAASIHEGDTIVFRQFGRNEEITVDRVLNSTPRAGKITWYTTEGETLVVGGADKFEVVALV